jgi:hypothetical protein
MTKWCIGLYLQYSHRSSPFNHIVRFPSEFIRKLIKNKTITEAKAFNLTFRYTGDDMLINNPHFANWLSLINIPSRT